MHSVLHIITTNPKVRLDPRPVDPLTLILLWSWSFVSGRALETTLPSGNQILRETDIDDIDEEEEEEEKEEKVW